MQNPDYVTSSVEKFDTHVKINTLAFPWIKNFFSSGAQCFMMPCNKGKQESEILSYVHDLERERSQESKVKMYTFDRDYEKHDITDMQMCNPRVWEHFKCSCIFDKIMKHSFKEMPTFAWFDLCGGLTAHYRRSLLQCINKCFAHGSLLFITLQVKGIRHTHALDDVVDHAYEVSNDPEYRMKITDQILKRTIASNGTKYLCDSPMKHFSYVHKPKTFGIFGYIVGDHNNQK